MKPLEWLERGACVDVDPEVFTADNIGYEGKALRKARAICAECPVQTECLDYALSFGSSLVGIYAGTTMAQRRRMSGLRRTRSFANHGTRSKYSAGCRCEGCTRANRDYLHRWRYE